jgi:RND family efflux transporter MFP subunit
MPPDTPTSQTAQNIFRRLGTKVFAYIRSHKILSVVIGGVMILGIVGMVFLLKPKEPEIITNTALRGDLVQTVEAVGTIISEKDLGLLFPISGIVSQVLVKEGDHVKAGQKLAYLRAGNLAAQVSAAAARLQAAEASLQQLLEGARPEDIAIAEAEVENKRSALQAERVRLAAAEQKLSLLEEEADTSLAGYITTAESTVSEHLATIEIALGAVDDVLTNPDVADGIIRMGSPQYLSPQEVDSAVSAARAVRVIGKESALEALKKARSAASGAAAYVQSVFTFVANLTTSNALTTSERETHKTTIATQRSNVQSSLSSLDAETKALQDASANFDTKIATEESAIASAQGNILTYESALRIQEATLALKKAPPRQTDIAAEQARVREARAELGRVNASYADTILTAPIEGTITKVNLKAGESLSTSFETDAAITMLGASPYRVEMYVAEIDIPKVALTQTGSIELDAFRGTPFPLIVNEIDPVSTDRDGVPKYRVKLDFPIVPEDLRVGMTGDAKIFTGLRKDVVSVPLRAVLESDDETSYVRILKDDGKIEERTVSTGMEGEGGNIEVVGVREGETVIVLVKE